MIWPDDPDPNLIGFASRSSLLSLTEWRLQSATIGTGWDVANAALFLASDEANFITGVTLPMEDGASVRPGWIARTVFEPRDVVRHIEFR